MTHSDSPPGLLPRYSSWSLCCIGRASDYAPAKGNDRLNWFIWKYIIKGLRTLARWTVARRTLARATRVRNKQ